MVFIRRRGLLDSGTYKIRLYRYGSLYTTLYCTKGSFITLVPTPSEYADDTFYGYSTAYNSVTRTYTGTQVITPTSDVNLYAIYSFTATESSVQQVHKEGSAGQTLTVTNAVVGTTYSVFESISTPWWEVAQSDPSHTTIIPHTSTETTTKIDNASVTSNAISYTFSNFQSTTINGPYGVSGKTSWTGWIDYTANVTQTGIKYRVVSHDNPSVINVYRYGELYRSYSIQEGLSITVGSCEAIYADDTFFGYSVNPNSTTRTYAATSNIAPHGVLDLYVVYSYIVVVAGTKTVHKNTSMTTSPQTVTLSATAELSGTATFSCGYDISTPGGHQSGPSSFSVDNTQYKGGASINVSAGQTINMKTTVNACSSPVSGSVSQNIQYPAYIGTTKYRVVSHEGG